MTILQGAEAAAIAGVKGAAAGIALGPIGAGVGGLIGIASSLLSVVLPEAAKPMLQAAAAAITGQVTEDAQAAAIVISPDMAQKFHVEALKIAQSIDEQKELTRRAEIQAAVKDFQTATADTANARATSAQYAQMGSKLQWVAPVVSIVATVGFFFAFAVLILTHGEMDANRTAMINILIGGLGTGYTTVLAFWLGSSAGSARKTEMQYNSVPAHLLPVPLVPAEDAKLSTAQQDAETDGGLR